MTFDKFNALTTNFDIVYIEWELSDTIEDLDDYVFVLYRGLVQDELEEIGIFDMDTTIYEDTTISDIQYDKLLNLYYQVEAHHLNDNTKHVFSKVEGLNQPDLRWEALEIIRRDTIGLRNVLRSSFTLLKQKHTGTQCTCYDTTLGRKSVVGDCLLCYNTNWTGGYYNPIIIYGTIGGWGETVRSTSIGDKKDSITNFVTTYYPRLNVNDIVIDNQGNRWRLTSKATSRLNAVEIKQVFQVTIVDRNDVVYKVPVIVPEVPDLPIGTVLDPSAASLFNRMTVAPDVDRKLLINDLITDLKEDGIWDKLDALYIMAAHDEQAATLNWIADKFNITAVNSPIFTINEGYKGDGFTSYLDTNFSVLQANLSLNSASIGLKSNTELDEDSTDIGAMNLSLRINHSSTLYGQVNTNIAITRTNVLSVGLFVLNRPSSEITEIYKDGGLLEAISSPSVGLPTESIYICAKNNGGASEFSTRQYSMAFLGTSLTSDDNNNLNTFLNTYLNGL